MAKKHWGPPGELMNEEELHDFGIQVVANDLKEEGQEVVSIDTELGREPQIVARMKGGQLAFILVRTEMYPGNGRLSDLALVDRLLAHAKAHHAVPYFASVGIANAKGVDAGDEDQSSRPVRGAGFYVNYRGLRILARPDQVRILGKNGLTELIPKDLDSAAFSKAVENIAADLGSLDDLPIEVANTVANVYYAFWKRLLALGPLREGAAAPADAKDHPDGILAGYMHYIKTNPSVIAGYKFASEMIKTIRSAATKHPDRKVLVDYMGQVFLDSLKYGIDNAHQKTPMRRAIERRFKKPDEIPDLYKKMRPLLAASLTNNSDG